MAKKESTLINMLLTLFIITLVASVALGYIFEITKEPISQTQLKKKLKAISEVVPAFTNDPNADMFKVVCVDGTDSLEVYPAKNNDSLVGVAVKTYTNKGFSGYVEVMVGFKPDGTIINTSVLSQKETPGLGTKMTIDCKSDPKAFKCQFNEKNPSTFKVKVKKDGGDVDAITAATISSRAFCDAINRAYDSYMKGGQK